MKHAAQKSELRDSITGFTIIELMLGLALAAIVFSLAVPSVNSMMLNNHLTNQANDIIASQLYARSEALKRVKRVTVCKSANGASCTSSGGWQQGWIIFVDDDNDAAKDGGEELLRVFSALKSGRTLNGSTNVSNYVSYVSSGQIKLANGSFQSGSLVLCDDRGASYARVIQIDATGRSGINDASVDSCTP
jgi:type IV fimbrial biogenesis protein FimT